MVTHDLDLAQRVSRMVMLADGEIVDEQASNFGLQVLNLAEKNPTAKTQDSAQEASHVKT